MTTGQAFTPEAMGLAFRLSGGHPWLVITAEHVERAKEAVILRREIQKFFAEHGEAWLDRFSYREAGPHLLLMAFLQRIVNGGGRIRREFAVGSGRADLVVEYGQRRSVLELKLRRGPETEKEGLLQLSAYLDRPGEPEGHLVIFDLPWADRLYIKEAAGPRGQRIHVFGV